MNQRRTCRILDAKAAQRAWSKRRLLARIFAMAIAATMAAPTVSYAVETSEIGIANASVTEGPVAVVVESIPTGIDCDEAAIAGTSASALGTNQDVTVPSLAASNQATAAAENSAISISAPNAQEKTPGSSTVTFYEVGNNVTNTPQANALDVTSSDVKGGGMTGTQDAVAATVPTQDAGAVAVGSVAGASAGTGGTSQPSDSSSGDGVNTDSAGTNGINIDGVNSTGEAGISECEGAAGDNDTVAADIVTGTSTTSSTTLADSYGTHIQFDYDGDGATTQADWEAYLKEILSRTYTSFDDDVDSGERDKGREKTLSEMVNGTSTDDASITLTDQDISAIKSYYLTNIGQVTSIKSQEPWNDCWAFAVISALESSILKARAGAAGQVVDTSQHTTPKLEGIEDTIDLSELYYAWLAHSTNPSGSQKGEGLTNIAPEDVRDQWQSALYAGYLGGFAERLLGAWRGIATEEEYPYWSKELTEKIPQLLEEAYQKNDGWASSSDAVNQTTYRENPPEVPTTSASQAVDQIAHVNGVLYLPEPNVVTFDSDGKAQWVSHNDHADQLIKQALVKYGAVAIAYRSSSNDYDAPYYNYWYGAQYNDTATPNTDHTVTIVGWNDDFDASQFSGSKNDVSNLKNGAWLVKNSWGSTDWYRSRYGEGWSSSYGILDENYVGTGFFWLSYYDHTISSPIAFSVDDGADGFDYDNNYSYDTAVVQDDAPFVLRTDDNGTFVANVFRAENDEILKAVSVRTNQENSNISIMVYLVTPEGLADNDPTNDGGLVFQTEYDAAVPGLHTVELYSPVRLAKGQLFAVVENVCGKAADSSSQSWLNLETGISQLAQQQNDQALSYYRSAIVANDGETFVRVLTSSGYQWLTPKELSQAILNGGVIEFGNALVKAFTVNVDSEQEQTVPIYRLYNQYDGDHLFTTNKAEYDELAAIGWTGEGVAWQTPAEGPEVYRLYNRWSGEHFYTDNASEYDQLESIGWTKEGVAFHTSAAGGSPVYRLYNKWLTVGTHLFTTDVEERDNLVELGWQYEGIAFRTAKTNVLVAASTEDDSAYCVPAVTPVMEPIGSSDSAVASPTLEPDSAAAAVADPLPDESYSEPVTLVATFVPVQSLSASRGSQVAEDSRAEQGAISTSLVYGEPMLSTTKECECQPVVTLAHEELADSRWATAASRDEDALSA